ncbi:MAG TPA: DUF1501 domain-containing protein [Thermoanaerobaculia bacterium]|nr:DUF1501 domain-containing protein [Thermoanaerobaculia bacterium]
MPISRRDFLLKSAGFVSVSAMAPRFRVEGAQAFEESLGAEAAGRTLVVLELMGGNDGLNTIVPYADSKYPQLRSRIGVPVGTVLQLDTRLGLNPVMGSMMSLWNANRLAIVENVGYPNSSLSHFSSRDIWHTADPTLAQRRGWLGRWADEYLAGDPNPLKCTAISQTLPKTLLADNVRVPSFVSLATYSYQTDGKYTGDRTNQMNAFLAENSAEYETPVTVDTLGQIGEDAVNSSALLQTVGAGYVASGAYPSGSLAQGLLLCAQIINANVGARILYVTYGGFDNHAGEDNDHDPLVRNVSDSIKAFFDDLDGHGKSHDVLLMSWSEFGRRVQDNASNGTDHGTSAPHFVVGNAVNKGIYGSSPDLMNLDPNGNLHIENDFRSYYGTVLSDWLKVPDVPNILGAGWPNLGFLDKSYV